MKENLKKDYFSSIEDLPIWNWWKVSETGDVTYLLKDKEIKVDINLHEVWNKIHDEYLDNYGRTREYERVLRLKKQWILKQAKFLVEGDRFASTEADILESQINEKTSTENIMTREDSIIFLEEKLGRGLDEKVLSVKKYNDYIRYYSKK